MEPMRSLVMSYPSNELCSRNWRRSQSLQMRQLRKVSPVGGRVELLPRDGSFKFMHSNVGACLLCYESRMLCQCFEKDAFLTRRNIQAQWQKARRIILVKDLY